MKPPSLTVSGRSSIVNEGDAVDATSVQVGGVPGGCRSEAGSSDGVDRVVDASSQGPASVRPTLPCGCRSRRGSGSDQKVFPTGRGSVGVAVVGDHLPLIGSRRSGSRTASSSPVRRRRAGGLVMRRTRLDLVVLIVPHGRSLRIRVDADDAVRVRPPVLRRGARPRGSARARPRVAGRHPEFALLQPAP